MYLKHSVLKETLLRDIKTYMEAGYPLPEIAKYLVDKAK